MSEIGTLISFIPERNDRGMALEQAGVELNPNRIQQECAHANEEPWDEFVSLEWLCGFPIYRTRESFLGSHFIIKKGYRILEAGSGPAHDSLVFARKGAIIFAVDKSMNALTNAVRIYDEKGYHIKAFLSDIREMPIRDSTFDMTWNAGVLEHFEEEVSCRIVKEMKRVTKPGGIILVIAPNRSYFWYQKYLRRNENRQYSFERGLTIGELESVFRRNNIKIIGISGNYVHPDPSFLWGNVRPVWWLSRFSRFAFSPLEASIRSSRVKALLSLDICVWGRK